MMVKSKRYNVSGFTNLEEVRNLVSLGRIESKHLGNLSLGKLRNDVLKELDGLYGNLK